LGQRLKLEPYKSLKGLKSQICPIFGDNWRLSHNFLLLNDLTNLSKLMSSETNRNFYQKLTTKKRVD